jgi:hypothetical protein
MARARGGAIATLADHSAALYRPCSYFRVGIADVSRKSEADVRLLWGRTRIAWVNGSNKPKMPQQRHPVSTMASAICSSGLPVGQRRPAGRTVKVRLGPRCNPAAHRFSDEGGKTVAASRENSLTHSAP